MTSQDARQDKSRQVKTSQVSSLPVNTRLLLSYIHTHTHTYVCTMYIVGADGGVCEWSDVCE